MLSLSGYALAPLGVLLALAVSPGAWLVLLALGFLASGYPLLWVGGREVWSNSSRRLLVLAGLVVPCVTLIALINLRVVLRRELRKEGFQARLLRVIPLAP